MIEIIDLTGDDEIRPVQQGQGHIDLTGGDHIRSVQQGQGRIPMYSR